jgi:large subunit ribosomal protein L9
VGDKVSVKSGFARNYLVPQAKAKIATAANVAEFEAIRAELEKAAGEARTTAESRKQAIEAIGTIEVTAKVGSEGKLFGSVGVADVCAVIESHGQIVEKSEIRMPEGALRSVGEHQVDIHLYTDIDTRVTVNIIGEE